MKLTDETKMYASFTYVCKERKTEASFTDIDSPKLWHGQIVKFHVILWDWIPSHVLIPTAVQLNRRRIYDAD